MALPMLVGGAECGPSNPLQTLAKRYDQDRGLQQDYFGTNRAGSSGASVRSHAAGPSAPDQEAARFFASQTTSHAVLGPSLDLSSLRETLPMTDFYTNVQQHPTADWAADFSPSSNPGLVMMAQGSKTRHSAPASSSNKQQMESGSGQTSMHWNTAMSGLRMNAMPMYSGPANVPMQAPVRSRIDQTLWDKEFTSQEQHLSQDIKLESIESQIQQPSDELAQTAAMLLEQVKHEQNPKFKNSQFMDLMRQLRDGRVTVEGSQMVETDEETVSRSNIKGKGRAIDDLGLGQPSVLHLTTSQTTLLNNLSSSMDSRQEADSREEDANDAYFRQDNEDYMRYWAEKHNLSAPNRISVTEREWDKLQADWDRFEATATGIQEVQIYPFQASNPYLLGDSSRFQMTQQSMIERSVLELEAAVQRDMNNTMAWYHLGIKQQENEREHKALQALKRAVELNPSHLPSWLALAVSYTNDNNRTGTYDSILEWITRNEKYKDALLPLRAQILNDSGASLAKRYEGLINGLIAMARSNNDDQIDADIQIALAVLLNSNEEYDKAQDCFRTALALRPDDWLLYNRVGATMANSGHAEEALRYYYRALELNPGYIRARFNLGISCINLRRCEEAAQHILDALVLQENDGTAGQNRGVTSSALWESLKTACLHMRRVDLATLCDRKDLDGFRTTFH
ncbi:hypothetical protein F5887DRAFT_953120 [Amanita rubescens]|nr:hypothetical protein F5887DRAFT_953120 [Amanita rubescens]